MEEITSSFTESLDSASSSPSVALSADEGLKPPMTPNNRRLTTTCNGYFRDRALFLSLRSNMWDG